MSTKRLTEGYFCNSCGHIELQGSGDCNSDGNCYCGEDNWLEIGDEVKLPLGHTGFVRALHKVEDKEQVNYIEVDPNFSILTELTFQCNKVVSI